MDLNNPARSILPTLEAQVLTVLTKVIRPMSGREISRLAEAKSHAGIRLALERLYEQGVVEKQKIGTSNLYSLNRDHLAYPAIEALMDLRGRLFRRMTDAINEWQIPPVSVSVFGSTARGDGGVDSDIDILVIQPDELLSDGDQAQKNQSLYEYQDEWAMQLANFGSQVQRWSGNKSSIIQLSKPQLEVMVAVNDPFAASLMNESRHIWGEKI